MPKFYRQNRKRIDPRYFLNETTNRGLDENSISPAQKRINAETFYPMLKKLAAREDLDSKVKAGIDDLLSKTVNTIRREGEPLSDEQLKTLAAASTDFSSLASFPNKVIAMVSQGAMSSGGDADADGTSDREELMKIAQNMPEPTDDLGRTEFDQLEYDIEALFSDSAFMNTIGRSEVDKINDVIAKVQKSGSGRSADLVPDSVVAATDEEKAQLAAAAKESSAALYNVIKQMA